MLFTSHPLSQARHRSWRLILLLCGWCLGTGVQWDAVQVAAWGRMYLQNVRTESLPAALATTFSPEGMCSACHAVQAVKQTQAEREGVFASVPGKAPLLLVSAPRTLLTMPAARSTLVEGPLTEPAAIFMEPPVPPPRGQVV